MTTNAKPKILVLQLLGGKLCIRKMQVLQIKAIQNHLIKQSRNIHIVLGVQKY
jgi:hypothetical protein